MREYCIVNGSTQEVFIGYKQLFLITLEIEGVDDAV
jgi:hypothetical protein